MYNCSLALEPLNLLDVVSPPMLALNCAAAGEAMAAMALAAASSGRNFLGVCMMLSGNSREKLVDVAHVCHE
jgi:hypothetical protein